MKATKQLRRKELAAAISMLLVLPASALAQDQEQDSNISMEDDLITEEVIVTGIRRGLMNSIDIKGTSNSIVEAVSAEDIGKFPEMLGDSAASAQYARDCANVQMFMDQMDKPVVAAVNVGAGSASGRSGWSPSGGPPSW